MGVVLVSAPIRYYSTESARVYRSGVHSGIVGHPGTNTYHQSIENLPSMFGYSNRWRRDKVPPGDWSRKHAVADDLSLSRNDMIEDWNRHYAVFKDYDDPRRSDFAEYIGTPDGITAYRMDFADGSIDESDGSHTWHAHNAPWRELWDSWPAAYRRLSVRRGESKYLYIASIAPRNLIQTMEDDEMIEYIWYKRAGDKKGDATTGAVTYAIERPYSDRPVLQWEETTNYPEAVHIASRNRVSNQQLSEPAFDARKKRYVSS